MSLIPARAAAWGATLTGKLVLWGLAVALVAFTGYRVYYSFVAYDRGIAAERKVWTDAQDKANREQAEREEAQETTARASGEASREKGQEQREAAGQAATKTSEAIQREYQSKPATAVPCTADGRPADLPRRVQDELRKAQRSAEAAGR